MGGDMYKEYYQHKCESFYSLKWYNDSLYSPIYVYTLVMLLHNTLAIWSQDFGGRDMTILDS